MELKTPNIKKKIIVNTIILMVNEGDATGTTTGLFAHMLDIDCVKLS